MTERPEEDEAVVRDAEATLVAALQESDSAVDTAHDAAVDAGSSRRRHALTLGGVLLAIIGLVVVRRRG